MLKKIFRILGEWGRITVPYKLRKAMGLKPNDILSFTQIDADTFAVKREKICNNCKDEKQAEAIRTNEVAEFIEQMPSEFKRAMFEYFMQSRGSDGQMRVRLTDAIKQEA